MSTTISVDYATLLNVIKLAMACIYHKKYITSNTKRRKQLIDTCLLNKPYFLNSLKKLYLICKQSQRKLCCTRYATVYNMLYSFSQFPIFCEGRSGRSTRISLYTASSISQRLNPKRFHPKFSMWFNYLSLGRLRGLLLSGIADTAFLGSLFWGILLTWPNHQSFELLIQSRDSTFSELWISGADQFFIVHTSS